MGLAGGWSGLSQGPLSQPLGYTLVSMSWSFIQRDRTLGTVTPKTDGWIRSQGSPLKEQKRQKAFIPARNRFEGCDVGKGRSHTGSSVSEDLGRNSIPKEGRGENEAAPECSSPLSSATAQQDVIASKSRVTWCAVGSEEKRKCDQWNRASSGRITCTSFPTTEDCIIAIMVGSRCHTCCGRWAS